MVISLQAIGDLREYFGRAPTPLTLPEGALVQDLLDAVDAGWGERLPGYLWDRELRRFKGPVLLVIDKKAVQDLCAPLWDGLEIRVMRAIAGGSEHGG
jgi:hypothetical protein